MTFRSSNPNPNNIKVGDKVIWRCEGHRCHNTIGVVQTLASEDVAIVKFEGDLWGIYSGQGGSYVFLKSLFPLEIPYVPSQEGDRDNDI